MFQLGYGTHLEKGKESGFKVHQTKNKLLYLLTQSPITTSQALYALSAFQGN